MGVRVEVRGLTRHFEKGGHPIRVLQETDLDLAAGDSVALLGQSGSGKSTFLQILGALEPPSSGEVRVDGVNIHRLAPTELDRYRNRTVGFIFQFHHLLPDHSAFQNVAMPALIAGLSSAELQRRAEQRLKQVGIYHRKDHLPGELSGGEQQRVAIARALMMEPGLLLADEPTGNLDPATASEVLELLLSLNREQGATLVLVTHSLELSRRLPRRIRLVGGRFEEVVEAA